MAEAAGLVVGGIALVTLFDSAMNAFDYIDAGASYGREYNKLALQENLLKLRLTRWEEGVRVAIRTAEMKGKTVGTKKMGEDIRELLGEIGATIEDTRKVAERYKIKDGGKVDADVVGEKLISRVRSLAAKRQKQTSLGSKVRWALRDVKKFHRLVEDLSEHVTALENVFPPDEFFELVQRTQELAIGEVSELIYPDEIEEPADDGGETIRGVLEEATEAVDPVLGDAVREEVERARQDKDWHSYEDFKTSGSKLQAGDVVQPGNKVVGFRKSYKRFATTDGAKVLAGDFYGKAKYVLDD